MRVMLSIFWISKAPYLKHFWFGFNVYMIGVAALQSLFVLYKIINPNALLVAVESGV